ncbi:hypothetical protein, partial [uncultured Bilophila sp.]|uniref:hypothetical protein n=1 Tax=uncultured Bilophila sp. TaxID=529385 RepID=UPI00259415D0
SWLPPGDGLPEVSSFGLHYFKGGLQASFKKLLAQTALATLKDQMSVIVHIPRKVWIGGSILALLNLLSLFLFLINVI